ncbi:hypothetical protein AOQ84DRAFT_325712 [Glonium stellatum]|uniref:F-box domain-containing protein n=1 Tax=Glonium stellatum TaxID=574774 RepID=A0A8E2JNC9_9PEZI|nr:hypothetical protein AOQ84DRAFT_325712 [Glonium stellatum]
MELLDLCYDVLIRILQELDPEDLANCSHCCRSFNSFIKGNRRLFRILYLERFDDPRRHASDAEPHWEKHLPILVKCQKILQSDNFDVKKLHFDFVTSTVESLLKTSSDKPQPSLNISFLAEAFKSPRNVDAFLCRSSLFARAETEWRTPAKTEEQRQLSAKLHCHYGSSVNPTGRRSSSPHPYARSYVYDLRNYTDKTQWGPFRTDGSLFVDWEMVEAIMIVLAYNMQIFSERAGGRFKPVWGAPFDGVANNNFSTPYPLALPEEPEIPLQARDPYDISGTWMRVVCFLDYNDLYAFNFTSSPVAGDEPRVPLYTEEAIRLIVMKLKVTKIEAPSQFDNPSLPIVHFAGSSRSLDSAWDPNANSRIKGHVRLTPEGEVRWTTVSIFYGGEERWRSEGVQVGGICSKRGVVGSWFDKDYDVHGPVGPTAFWKLGDQATKVRSWMGSTSTSESESESESVSDSL